VVEKETQVIEKRIATASTAQNQINARTAAE